MRMENFGFALRLARERRGLTQMRVMELTGISNKALSRYENGLSEPDLRALGALLKLYGVSANRFLGLEETEGQEALWKLDQWEWELLELFRRLDQREREECVMLLRTLMEAREKGK